MKPSDDPFKVALKSARKTQLRLVLGGAATLGIVLGFLLLVNGINVEIEPSDARAGASVEVEEGIGFAFGSSVLTVSQKIVIGVRAPGFASKRAPIVVNDVGKTVTIKLDPLPGVLVVEVSPAEADGRLFVDGEQKGLGAHHEVELTQGIWQVEYRHPHYEEFSEKIEVAGKAVRQNLNIKLRKTARTYAVETTPPGASLFVDDILVGQTPGDYEIAVGKRRIKLSLAGYQDLGQSLQVVEGAGSIAQKYVLQLLPGELKLESKPSKANVMVDAVYVGQTPLEISLDPTTSHSVSLNKPGYVTVSRKVTVKSGQKEQLVVPLPPNLGKVTVKSTPKGDLWVDGRPIGSTPQVLELTSIKHVFEIKRSGYRGHVKALTPNQSYAQEIDVHLKTNKQALLDEAANEVSNSVGQNLVLFVPGRLTMGAPRGEKGQRANEVIRDVILTKPFYIGQNEVTAAQFGQFKKTNSLGNSFQHSDLPMVNVSWVDAARYCNWLSRRENLDQAYRIVRRGVSLEPTSNGYRLPTESEWVWVARFAGAGKGRKPLKFPWGAKMPVPPNAGNYADESAKTVVDRFISKYDDGYSGLAPVGSFPRSAAGLNDIGGNVSELTNDYHDFVSTDADGPEIDRLGPKSGEARVIRGASWKSASLTKLRLSYRGFGNGMSDDVGFRVARWLGE